MVEATLLCPCDHKRHRVVDIPDASLHCNRVTSTCSRRAPA